MSRLASICIIFWWISPTALAQSQATAGIVEVQEILISGPNTTKRHVIERELDFAVGDTLSMNDLMETLERNEKRLLSCGLFNRAKFHIHCIDLEHCGLSVELQLNENWYIYPGIIFELADRNFNVWWKTYNFDFDRVNYGARFDHINLTGNKDRLKLLFQRGYIEKYELAYGLPYISEGKGLSFNVFFAEAREINIRTRESRQQFVALPSNEKLANRFRVGVNYSNRIDAFTTSDWNLQYHNNWVHPILISDQNPNYFPTGGSRIRYLSLEYNLVHDQRILPIYPEGGHLYFLQIKKDGLGILENGENFSLAIGGEKYFKPHPNIIWGGRIKLRYNLDRSTQGYFNYTALGYGDNIKGYELYVIDGKDYALLKTAWRFRLIQKNIHLGKLMPFKRMRTMPLLLFFRLSTEVAYVNDPVTQADNPFSKRALVGYGPAIDLMMYYNFSMSAEYNINHLGQRGFYLNSSFSF